MPWLILLVVASGACLAVQAGVNTRMGTGLGAPVLGAFTSFGIGLVGLAVYALVIRVPLPTSEQTAQVPWWAWTGGILGAVYVVTVILATPRLGVAVTMSVAIAGQLVTAVLLDHFGIMLAARQPLTPARVLGVLLIIAGVVLVRRF